jgi:hypothetical protein
MKYLLIYLLGMGIGVSPALGQTLRRESLPPMVSQAGAALPYHFEADIFEQYAWARPQISGREISLTNGGSGILWMGKTLSIKRDASDGLTITTEDGKSISATAITDNKRYFDHRSVVLASRTVFRHVPSYRSVAYQAPYQASRSVPVTSYRYNYATKSTQTVYSTRTEFYTAYRTQFRYETTWSWQQTTEFYPKVLPSTYYSFSLDDAHQLTIYEKVGKYYLQNPSFMVAQAADGVNCLLVDFNANGSYFDPQDRVMWTAWNPYNKESKYNAVKGFRGNAWYSLLDLEESYLVSFDDVNGKLSPTSLNKRFANVKGKGTVGFQGLPQDAKVKVNGKKINLNAKGKPLPAEYGEYHYVISVPNHLDTFGKFVVDADHPAPQISYSITAFGVQAKFVNPPQPEYFVTVSDGLGGMRTYQSPTEIPLPLGQQEMYIEVSGVVLNREVNIVSDQPFELDLASAFNAAATSLEEEATPVMTDSIPVKGGQGPVITTSKAKGK